jgi:hypothetical protein
METESVSDLETPLAEKRVDKPSGDKDYSDSRLNWHNVELILKWTAVAYGFGFLTVMWHTHRLGVPVLQLIEPVNVWIGAPLAIVVFFIEKLVKAANKIREDFVTGLKEVRGRAKAVTESKDLQMLAERTVDLMATSSILAIPLFGKLSFVKGLLKKLFTVIYRLSGLFDPQVSDRQRERTLAHLSRTLAWSQFVAVTGNFIDSVVTLCVVPLACFVYVVAIYPLIPQTLGGGKPVDVQVVVSEESIPEAKEFEGWVSSSRSATTSSLTTKRSLIVPVTLYFRTDHDLYIRKGDGPIISLSEHAVEGIIFNSKRTQASNGITQNPSREGSPNKRDEDTTKAHAAQTEKSSDHQKQ